MSFLLHPLKVLCRAFKIKQRDKPNTLSFASSFFEVAREFSEGKLDQIPLRTYCEFSEGKLDQVLLRTYCEFSEEKLDQVRFANLH